MQSPNVAIAVQMYYEKPELTSADIKKLFGCCSTTATKLKKEVFEAMAKEEKKFRTWQPGTVNTKFAYEVWKIDVADFEERLKKLNKLSGVLAR